MRDWINAAIATLPFSVMLVIEYNLTDWQAWAFFAAAAWWVHRFTDAVIEGGGWMIPLAIQGTTRRIGKSQGYAGLCIQDTQLRDGTPVMLSAWEPTPSELAALNDGQPLYLWVLGTGHPPLMITVDPPSDQREGGRK